MDSKWSVSSYEAFWFLWFTWKMVGMVPPNTNNFILKILYNIYGIFINMAGSIISPAIIFTSAFVLNNVGLILQSLQISIPMLVSSLKQAAIYLKINKLHNENNYLKKLDQKVSLNMEEVEHIRGKIRQCHKMFYIVAISYFSTLLVYSAQGYFSKQLPFGSWFPFDWRSSAKNYQYAFWLQILGGVYQIIQNIANDVYSVSYINIINGHIHCLCLRISRIGWRSPTSLSENNVELAKCVEDHKNIIR